MSIKCNISIFVEFRMKIWKMNCLLDVSTLNSLKIFLLLVYVTLWRYENLSFLFTSSQHFYVISKCRNSGGGICKELLWCTSTPKKNLHSYLPYKISHDEFFVFKVIMLFTVKKLQKRKLPLKTQKMLKKQSLRKSHRAICSKVW